MRLLRGHAADEPIVQPDLHPQVDSRQAVSDSSCMADVLAHAGHQTARITTSEFQTGREQTPLTFACWDQPIGEVNCM